MEKTKRTDPLETGQAPWSEKAARLAREWAAGKLERGGVNLVEVLEYVMVEAINRAYAEAAHG